MVPAVDTADDEGACSTLDGISAESGRLNVEADAV